MPKVKTARKSTAIDMTAMCDVAFLLLTFFILTSKMVVSEAVMVKTPSSTSEIKVPDVGVITVIINKEGKVFFGIDGQEKRKELLKKMAAVYPALDPITKDGEKMKVFSLVNSFGIPISEMDRFLSANNERRSSPEFTLGIPIDSTDNQFKEWMKAARSSKDISFGAKLAIKADAGTPYKVIKNVMKTLQDMDENRYNLITSLEAPTKKK